MKNTTNINDRDLSKIIEKTKKLRFSRLQKFIQFTTKYSNPKKLKHVIKEFNREIIEPKRTH